MYVDFYKKNFSSCSRYVYLTTSLLFILTKLFVHIYCMKFSLAMFICLCYYILYLQSIILAVNTSVCVCV